MFGGSAYLFAIIKYFSFAFFRLFLLQCNFFPLQLRHQTDNTKWRAGRPGGPYCQMKKHEFSAGWWATEKGGPAGYTTGRASGLHMKAGRQAAHLAWLQKRVGRRAAFFCSPPCPFPQPTRPPFCAACRPALLSSVQPASLLKIHVFHLETRPSSPLAFQLVLPSWNLRNQAPLFTDSAFYKAPTINAFCTMLVYITC